MCRHAGILRFKYATDVAFRVEDPTHFTGGPVEGKRQGTLVPALQESPSVCNRNAWDAANFGIDCTCTSFVSKRALVRVL